ncbi:MULTISPECIES: PAQR family membrane homeostasis protein TrhA [Mumia]|uniref:Hemolysin III family protein n=1 Tax=Mumia xiangluensis TaxID=1678900 RepID=A0ABW1QIG9_9ACTN|nr:MULTISPECIES: hemolysin III family protein [Mumia]
MTNQQAVPYPVGDRIRDAVVEIKPRLRGWLHAATWPLALAAFIVLLVLAPGAKSKTGVAVYMVSALLLFGVSAVYHVGRWGPRTQMLLKRFDHANIFLLIAGSYTPFALILLQPRDAAMLLTLVWVGAIGGVAFRVFWVHAPRWLYTPIYVLLGWAALLWLDEFAAASSTAVLVLIIVGGSLYSLGAVVYGLRYPDPFPRWFGFHEVFHTLTIAAFVVHYVGISLAAYAA